MKEQDVRAVESLCRCGMDLEAILKCFPQFPRTEIEKIFAKIRRLTAASA